MVTRTSFAWLPVAIAGFYTGLCASPAQAEVKRPKIAELAQDSALVVVAKVDAIRERSNRERWAKATVSEVWKGSNVETVEFLASPTWMCDITEAKQGESVLLFLTKSRESSGGWAIAWAGRGRMPVCKWNEKDFATPSCDVIFPHGTPSIATPNSDNRGDGFAWSIELGTLHDLVKESIEKKN